MEIFITTRTIGSLVQASSWHAASNEPCSTRVSFSALELRNAGAQHHAHYHTAGRMLAILQRAERRSLRNAARSAAGDEQPTCKKIVFHHAQDAGDVQVWRIEECN